MSKVRAALKRIHSPDILDLDAFRPQDGEPFGFLLQAMYGAADDIGEESFDIVVCTPGWLDQLLEKSPILAGRHYLFVREYNIDQVKQYLRNYAMHCEGETWEEVAQKLARIGHWEFEDYRE